MNEVENSGKVSWNRGVSAIGTGTADVYKLGSFDLKSICCVCMLLTSDMLS